MVTMVWIVSRFRLKGPSRYLIFIYISPLTPLRQRSRALWAPQPQKSATLSPQPGGKTTKFVRTGGGTGEKRTVKNLFFVCYRLLLKLKFDIEVQRYGNCKISSPFSSAVNHYREGHRLSDWKWVDEIVCFFLGREDRRFGSFPSISIS